MQKKLLALVVPALLATTAAEAAEVYNKDGNKLDLYGRVRAEHYMTDYAAKDGDQTYARLGFKGVTQITSSLTGYGQFEQQFSGNNAEGNGTTKTRLAFAGIKAAGVGSMDYGRNWGIMYDVGAFTDVLPEFSGAGQYYYSADQFMNNRANGLLTYRNTDFFGSVKGLNIAAQYQGKNEGNEGFDAAGNPVRKSSNQNGDGFGLSTSYTFGPGVTLGAAYTSSDRTLFQQKDHNGDKAQNWAVGAKYDNQGVYLAGTYSETLNMIPLTGSAAKLGAANKTQNYELVAAYQFDFGLKPYVAYASSKAKDIAGIGDAYLIKYVDLATMYNFNKNMNVFVDYKINRLGTNNALGLNSDNIVALGFTYLF